MLLKRIRGITFVEICLSLMLFGFGLSIFDKINNFYHQQNVYIHEMELVPIYVDNFTFFRSIHKIDRVGEWYAWQDSSTKDRCFSQEKSKYLHCPFIFKLESASNFSKTFKIDVFSTSSKRRLLSYLEEFL